MKRLIAVLLAAGLTACSPGGDDAATNDATGSTAPADPATPAYSTRIRWTSYGIPHVDAEDWGSLGYGFAYATANDAVCVIARDVVTVNGELARHFGDDDGNVASDVFHRAVLGAERIAGFEADQSERAAAFSRGYVAGYNRFLRDQAEALPAACANADWVRPIGGDDLTRLTIGVGIRYGLGRFREEMAAAAPPTANAVALRTAAPLHTDFSRPAGFGSNAVAVGRAASATGRGLLLGNPHYPWHGPSRFHLIHTTIPGEVDVMGVSLLNTTRVGIGFNRDVAWSHTVSTALRSTLYRLTLDPENPLRYRYGDAWRDMEPVSVRVPVAGDDGTETREHTVYFTHYGPVVSSAELPWTATTAYAVRDANLANDRSATTYDALARARDIDEVEAAISRQGVSWTNTIAADRHGTAFYADISVTPNVDKALLERCDARPDTVPAAVVVLDGADPDCEWRDDERSAIPGVLPAEEMPRLKRDDYVANSNDSYWLSNPEAPLEGFSPIIGAERTTRSLRTRAGLTFIREQLEADGDISADDLQAMLYSHRNFGAELLLDDVLTLCEPSEAKTLDGTAVDLGAACAALSGWDRRMSNASRGGQVWREFMRTARTIEAPFAVPFDPARPVATPRGFAVDDQRVRSALRTALATAVARLDGFGIPVDAPLGEIQYAQRHDERIAIPGGEGWAGMWSMIVTDPEDGSGYPPIVHGNSYIQVISWDEDGRLDPRAVLTYSQSPEPESPHYADMTRLYSRGEWARLPFSEDEIAADPNLVTLRLQE
jgi:acyl-homoserine-lactone acylase